MLNLGDELQVFAGTIDGEAEGEPLIGKYAVGSIILNRIIIAKAFLNQYGHNHPLFGDGTIRSACLVREQFSCWNPGPDHDRILNLDPNNPTSGFRVCLEVAQDLIQGKASDPTGGATHYFAISIPGPKWLFGAKWKGQFGNQLFWRVP